MLSSVLLQSVEGSISFAVIEVFASQYLQHLLCGVCSTCFAVHLSQFSNTMHCILCILCILFNTMQHPSSSCCISALLQNGRPTSLSLKLQAGREKTRAFIGKGGRGDLPLFLGHLLAHSFLGTLSNLD